MRMGVQSLVQSFERVEYMGVQDFQDSRGFEWVWGDTGAQAIGLLAIGFGDIWEEFVII
jgi:hypothetical protein